MKKVLAAAGIAGLALLAISAPANAGPDDKISICHATGSDSNPYTEITISENGLNGHNAQGVHDGDIVPAPAGGCPAGDNGDHDGDHDGDNGSESKKVTICHATGSEKNPYEVITIAEKAWLNGHKDGHNGNADIYPVPAKGCHEADDDDEENPGGGGGDTTVPPAVVPPAEAPPAAVPPGAGAAVVVPSGAGAVVAVNRGFNAQTAVATDTDAGLPGWVGGLAVLLTAASVVALRRRASGHSADAAI
jgi:hypothetical protein